MRTRNYVLRIHARRTISLNVLHSHEVGLLKVM